MNELVVAPVQWSKLAHINDVQPINSGDTECLAEIREVLTKHGMLRRFGLALLHSHFDLASDEIMLETTDPDCRRLSTEPIKLSEAGNNNVGTIWMFAEAGEATTSWCKGYCKRLPISKTHDPRHRSA